MSDANSSNDGESPDETLHQTDAELLEYATEKYGDDLFEARWYSFPDGAIVTLATTGDGSALEITPADGYDWLDTKTIPLNELTTDFFDTELIKVPSEAVDNPVTYRRELTSNVLSHTHLRSQERAGMDCAVMATEIVHTNSLAAADVSRDQLINVLTDLIALLRDSLLGYTKCHMPPKTAIENACGVLAELDVAVDDVIIPADQNTLGLDLPDAE